MTLSRRDLLRICGASAAGIGCSPWLSSLAAAAPADNQRHCILLWMPGGPSQTDTFDMKVKHDNGGEFKEQQTSVAGLRFSEHLAGLARQADQLAIVRSLSTSEGDHNRGTFLMHTGHRPGGPIGHPTIGASLSKALANRNGGELPDFISISPYTAFNPAAFSPGFLGPRHAPLTVGSIQQRGLNQQATDVGYAQLGVDDLRNPAVTTKQQHARLELWDTLQRQFLASHASESPNAHHTVYQRAVRMMNSEAAKAFDLENEPEKVRRAYGPGRFGQGCLMARRLVERGVPFIEVALRGGNGALGWDTHSQNFSRVKDLSRELDLGWSALMNDLRGARSAGADDDHLAR